MEELGCGELFTTQQAGSREKAAAEDRNIALGVTQDPSDQSPPRPLHLTSQLLPSIIHNSYKGLWRDILASALTVEVIIIISMLHMSKLSFKNPKSLLVVVRFEFRIAEFEIHSTQDAASHQY